MTLIEATKTGNLDAVNKLLAKGIDVNSVDVEGQTALWWAAKNGYTKIVATLLTVPDINVNALDRVGMTPLMCSILNGHTKIAKVLLTVPQININAVDKGGRSALLLAIRKGHLGNVKALLDSSELDEKEIVKNASALFALFKVEPVLITVLTKELHLEPSVLKHIIHLLAHFSSEDAVNKMPEVLGIEKAHFMSLISRQEKRRLAEQILISHAAARKLDNALIENIQGNESSMDVSLTVTANAHFKNAVKPAFEAEFLDYGQTQEERLSHIEMKIREMLLDKMKQALFEDFEKSEPDSDIRKERHESIQFIEANKEKLILGDANVLMQARLKHFTSNTDDAQIAWRGYDPDAPTAGWPNLLTNPTQPDPETVIFTTAASSAVQLNQNDAVAILRERAAYYFLVANDMDNLDQFVSYMALVRRAHNDDVSNDHQTDNPSCFPGQITRIAMIGSGHKIAELPRSAREIIEDEMHSMVIDAFQKALKSLSDDDKASLYYGLVMVNEHQAKSWLEKPSEMDAFEDKWLQSRQLFIDELRQSHKMHLERIGKRVEAQLGRPLQKEEKDYIALLPFNAGGDFVRTYLTNIYLTSTDKTPATPPLENHPFPLKDYDSTLNTLPKALPHREERANKQVVAAWEMHYRYEATLSVLKEHYQLELMPEQIAHLAKRFTEEYSDDVQAAFSAALVHVYDDKDKTVINEKIIQSLESALMAVPVYSPIPTVESPVKDRKMNFPSGIDQIGLFHHQGRKMRPSIDDEQKDDVGPKNVGP